VGSPGLCRPIAAHRRLVWLDAGRLRGRYHRSKGSLQRANPRPARGLRKVVGREGSEEERDATNYLLSFTNHSRLAGMPSFESPNYSWERVLQLEELLLATGDRNLTEVMARLDRAVGEKADTADTRSPRKSVAFRRFLPYLLPYLLSSIPPCTQRDSLTIRPVNLKLISSILLRLRYDA
jgi:hypothetical protein